MQKPYDYILNDNPEKSSHFNCFNRGNLVGLATCLALCGFTPIPLKANRNKKGETGLNYTCNVKGFKLSENLEERAKQVRKIFSQKEIKGIAIKCGECSNLLVIDVDDFKKFNEFYSLEKLKNEASYIIKTKDSGHYHFGFFYDSEFSESKNFLKQAGFELKSNGSLVNFYTILADFQYKPLKLEPLKELSQELKGKIKELFSQKKSSSSFVSFEPFKEELDFDDALLLAKRILEILSCYYEEGRRHKFMLYVSGLFRKAGIPKEIALICLEKFFKDRPEDEPEDRVRAIEESYKEYKPDRKISGLKGLWEEVGVKGEVLLEIKKLLKIKSPKIKLIPSIKTPEILKELSNRGEMALIRGFIYQGINLLAGPPKVGKTFLLIQKGFELAQMGYKVVYLALDESKDTFVLKLATLGLDKGHFNFNYYTRDDALSARFPLRLDIGGLEILEEVVFFYKPDVLIIDIWENIKPEIKNNKDFYSQDYEAISMLRTLTPYLKAIVICHHLKKGKEDDPVNRALGTSGLIGAVDTVVILERKRGEDKGRLLCVSRYDKEIELGLGYKNGRWEVLGDVKEVLISEGQREIIEIIKSLGGEASLDELSKFLNKSKSVLKVVIFNLIQKGIIERTQRGRYSLVKKSINQINHINFINHINQVNQGRSSMVNVVNDWLIESINQESLEKSKSEGLVNVVNVVNTIKDYKRVL